MPLTANTNVHFWTRKVGFVVLHSIYWCYFYLDGVIGKLLKQKQQMVILRLGVEQLSVLFSKINHEWNKLIK